MIIVNHAQSIIPLKLIIYSTIFPLLRRLFTPRRNILRYALRTRTIRCSFVKYCLPLTILLSISVYCSRLSSLSIIRYFWTAPSVHLCGWFACYSPQFILAIFCSIALFSEFLCSRCSLSLSLFVTTSPTALTVI